MEPPLADPMVDRPLPKSERQELLSGYDPVLPPGDRGDAPLDPSTQVVNVTRTVSPHTLGRSTLDVNVNPTPVGRAPLDVTLATCEEAAEHRRYRAEPAQRSS